jgi:hypothetical protein
VMANLARFRIEPDVFIGAGFDSDVETLIKKLVDGDKIFDPTFEECFGAGSQTRRNPGAKKRRSAKRA